MVVEERVTVETALTFVSLYGDFTNQLHVFSFVTFLQHFCWGDEEEDDDGDDEEEEGEEEAEEEKDDDDDDDDDEEDDGGDLSQMIGKFVSFGKGDHLLP